MWVLENTVTNLNKPIGLRTFLRDTWLIPRRFIHYLRVRKNILVNGEYRPVNKEIRNGDIITMTFKGDEFRTPGSKYISDDSLKLEVLYENRDLIVINKPEGIKSHPNQPNEKGTVMNFATAYLKKAYMVHRLDKETSGAMIIAKNPIVVPILNELIERKLITREYLAIVCGISEIKKGTIKLKIGKDPNDKRKRMVGGLKSKEAETEFEFLSANSKYNVVKLKLKTGRTHQIRVHLATIGNPIVGDPLYNQPLKRMMLHAFRLNLVIPFEMCKKTIIANFYD